MLDFISFICYTFAMENLEMIIAKNICEYRKMAKLTQIDLAEKLNFSDKSVSKWERGESLPDIIVLKQMCDIFGITLNDLTNPVIKKPKTKRSVKQNRILISLMSGGLVWLIATIAFVFLLLFVPSLNDIWLSFIYAIPASVIVFLVFSCLWANKWWTFTLASTLIWTIIVSICLTFSAYLWYLLYIAIPLQILLLMWFLMDRNKHKKTGQN